MSLNISYEAFRPVFFRLPLWAFFCQTSVLIVEFQYVLNHKRLSVVSVPCAQSAAFAYGLLHQLESLILMQADPSFFLPSVWPFLSLLE